VLRKYVLPFLIGFSLLLGACAPTTPASAPTSTQKPTSVPAFPLTIPDGIGGEVTFVAAPARIVSLSPSNTEILFAVSAGSLVVGNTKYCDFPAEAQKLPKVGGFSAKSISVEAIVALKPDLVVASVPGQGPVIEALKQANIQVIAIKADSFDDVYANIKMVGKITGHDSEAVAVVDGMKTRVAAVAEKISGISLEKHPTVFWEVWDEPLMTAGPGTFISQMLKIAGSVNIFADVKENYPQVSAEEIVKRNPAFIMGPDSHGNKLVAKQLAARPGWDQIGAVKNNKIFLVDGNMSSRPGPRLVDALEAIAKALHPDLFK